MAATGNIKDETRFNTIFQEYLSSKDVIDFTDDCQEAGEKDDHCSMSIYTNRRMNREAKRSHTSSIQDDCILQGEETNIFVDFDELLTGINAKQFKTYDNSPQSDLIIMENCLDSEDGDAPRSISILNRRLDGKMVKMSLGRSNSRDGQHSSSFKLVHALSKVSNLTEGSTKASKGQKDASGRTGTKKATTGISKQSFIKNQIKALLDYHVQRQGLPVAGKKTLRK